jgi:hypothetical protein
MEACQPFLTTRGANPADLARPDSLPVRLPELQ